MTFVTEGYPLIYSALAIAVIVFLMALRRRSWPLWLGGLVWAVGVVAIAWHYRVPLPSA